MGMWTLPVLSRRSIRPPSLVRMIRLALLLGIGLLVIAPVASNAAASTALNDASGGFVVSFAGRTSSLAPADPVGTDPFIFLDDPGFQQLLGGLKVMTDFAEGPKMLLVFGPGYEAHWIVGQKQATLKGPGATIELPGVLEMRDGRLGASFSTWTALLGLRARLDRSGKVNILEPYLDEVTVSPGTGQDVVLGARAPIDCDTTELDSLRKARLVIKGAALRTTRITIRRDGVELALAEKPDCPGKVVGMVSFPDNAIAEVQPRLNVHQVMVAGIPDYPVWLGYMPQRLENVECTTAGQMVHFRFKADGPIQYFWSWQASENRLLVDIPQTWASSTELKGIPAGGTPIVKAQLLTQDQAPYPVTRLAIDLAAGSSFEFATGDGNVLDLGIKPGRGEALADRGEGSTGPGTGTGIIVIDPGHGGSDPGACNRSSGLRETDINLDVALRLQEVLTERGWQVVLTRTNDSDVSYAGSPDKVELGARVSVANDINAMAFISLHCNAAYSSAHNGSSLHWYKSSDRVLARSLEEVLESGIGTRVRGLVRNRFYVLRHTQMPAVLVEMAFITNPHDRALLDSPGFRQRMAEHLADGLNSFMRSGVARSPGVAGD